MKALLSVCFFLGLLSPVALIQCYRCEGEEDCKTPEIQNCTEKQDACSTTYTINTQGDSDIMGFRIAVKKCSKSQDCLSNYYSVSTSDSDNLRSNVRCCRTDLCNDKRLTMPDRGKQRNGVKCPSCFELDSDDCEEEKILHCKGKETQCLKGTLDIATDFLEKLPVVLQGCATPSMCQVPLSKLALALANDDVTIRKRQCFNGTEELMV